MNPIEAYHEGPANIDYTKPPKQIATMRRFVLIRDEDMTGVSGTGIVAEGVMFSDGKVALRWRTPYKSTGVYDSMEELVFIHCHHDLTRIGWLDLEHDE